MSLPLHTGYFSPYVAAAPYGLLASAIARRAIRLRGCAIAQRAIRAAFAIVRHLCLTRFRIDGG